jgi:hypothetical protein
MSGPRGPGAGGRPDIPAPPTQLKLAVGVTMLEALALLALSVLLAVKALTGHPHSVAGALLGAALALLCAVVLALCGRGLLALRPAARTPVVVLEVLALPVSYDLSFQAGRVGYGAPILVVALVVLYLLFTPPVRAVIDREM